MAFLGDQGGGGSWTLLKNVFAVIYSLWLSSSEEKAFKCVIPVVATQMKFQITSPVILADHGLLSRVKLNTTSLACV